MKWPGLLFGLLLPATALAQPRAARPLQAQQLPAVASPAPAAGQAPDAGAAEPVSPSAEPGVQQVAPAVAPRPTGAGAAPGATPPPPANALPSPPATSPRSTREAAEGRVAPAKVPASASGQAGQARPTMDQVAEQSVTELHFGPTKARYSLNFFGDASFFVRTPSGPERDASFSLGAQDLLLRGELGSHIVATTEFAIEFDDDNEAGVDLERLHARWQNEHFFVEAGRNHTDLGYWNQAYHHGKWLQLTIDRPRWVRFEDEGGILPVHWVGLTAGAEADVGGGKLRFAAAVGNSRGAGIDDIRNEYDYSADKALHAKLEYVGLGLRDLRVGVSGVYGRIPAQPQSVRPALPGVSIGEWISGVHVAYPSVPLLLVVEAYLVEHRARGRSPRTYGGFAVLGYAFGPVTPYLELSRVLRAGGSDPFLEPDPDAAPQAARDVLDLVAGIRFDISAWSALKLEYDYSDERARRASHSVVLDWSWGF